jgi:hypothetical protein
MDCLSVAVLCFVDEKYHQKSDDCSSSVDQKLPSVALPKQRPCHSPNNDDEQRELKVTGCPSISAVHLENSVNQASSFSC